MSGYLSYVTPFLSARSSSWARDKAGEILAFCSWAAVTPRQIRVPLFLPQLPTPHTKPAYATVPASSVKAVEEVTELE